MTDFTVHFRPEVVTISSDDEEDRDQRPSSSVGFISSQSSSIEAFLNVQQKTPNDKVQSDAGFEEEVQSLPSIDLFLEEICPTVDETLHSHGMNAMFDVNVQVDMDSIWEESIFNETPMGRSAALEYEPGNMTAEDTSTVSGNGLEHVTTAGQKYHEVGETNDDGIIDFWTELRLNTFEERDFERPNLPEYEELGTTVDEICAKLQQSCQIVELGLKGQTVTTKQSDCEGCSSVESSALKVDGGFPHEMQSPQTNGSRNGTTGRRKGRKRKRGNSSARDKEGEPRPKSNRKAKKQVAAKRAEEGLVLRRNPSRAVSAPTDYNESKKQPRGKHLTSEYIVNLLQTCNLPRRAFNKRGALTGARCEDPGMSDTLWPADTLERPTLADVAGEIPSPPQPPTWGTVTHHILHCVLAMIKRYKSEQTIGFDRVSGSLIYIDKLMSVLTESLGETTAEKGSEKARTGMEVDEEQFSKDWRSKGEEMDAKSDGVVSVYVNKIRDAACELVANVRDVEERLRDQSTVHMMTNLVFNNLSLTEREHIFQIGPVPSLVDLEQLLMRAVDVYCLANQDVSEKDTIKYLYWAFKKERNC